MNDVGKRIEELRKQKGLSRPAFCDDESGLSVRQLARIEKGEFRPTIKTLEYIADRLEIPSYVLMPDYKELPKRYQELKYFLLHHPDYGDKELQEQKEEYFDEIFECFYDKLPRDEQVMIDCLQAIDQVRATDNEQYGQGIIEDYIETLKNQSSFSANDFLKLRLYFLCMGAEYFKQGTLSKKEQADIKRLFEMVCNQVEQVETSELFLVRDTLFASLGCCETMGALELFEIAIEKLKWITEKTRDFQKTPIIFMVEWKYYIQTDFNLAYQRYQEAIMFAKLFGNEQLIQSLDGEWETDIKKYL
ncbi:Transcriptional regulator [Streptococcus sp. DD10]|uniref:helix-turn-helix domain-containing protein n=1 Tax=Streptococcus sp. DD10 TaxID=1777878 RepID=UPI000793FA5B|nr:helix-turn-helix domain-containing protein [Streptococcus sp. DD10]KXT73045.1 Transcriptional regulator [Streptococcus sp. DD10]